MNRFAAFAVKVAVAGAVAMLSVGSVVATAASPSPNPSPTASGTRQPSTDRPADRRAVRRAAVEAESDILGIKPEALIQELKDGKEVSDLAKAKGLTKEQFATRLAANLKPRLDALVDHHVITRAQADRVLDRVARGFVPFWDGIHRRH